MLINKRLGNCISQGKIKIVFQGLSFCLAHGTFEGVRRKA